MADVFVGNPRQLYKEVRPGEFAREVVLGPGSAVSTTAPSFTLVQTSATLLAATSSEVSAWFDAQTLGVSLLHATRTSTGGAYALEVDWSRDGATADVTETLTPTNNASLTKDIVARYFRTRIRNTDAVAAFSAHRSTIYAR